MELKFDKEKNLQERLTFIHYYADWVKRVPNDVWSKEQAVLVDSFMQNARNVIITRKEYLQMVNER